MNLKAAKTPYFGKLKVLSHERPPESEEEKLRQEKLNEELPKGISLHSAVSDYGFVPDEQPDTDIAFQTGDLVKIFATYAAGEIEWEGIINLDRSDYHHGLQEGLDKKTWARMFFCLLPAVLTKSDGKKMFGTLDPFCETGTEGVIWSFSENGHMGYGSLRNLEDGDHLKIFKTVTNGDIAWKGQIELFPNENKENSYTNHFLRTAKHMNENEWTFMCYKRQPCQVTLTNLTVVN